MKYKKKSDKRELKRKNNHSNNNTKKLEALAALPQGNGDTDLYSLSCLPNNPFYPHSHAPISRRGRQVRSSSLSKIRKRKGGDNKPVAFLISAKRKYRWNKTGVWPCDEAALPVVRYYDGEVFLVGVGITGFFAFAFSRMNFVSVSLFSCAVYCVKRLDERESEWTVAIFF